LLPAFATAYAARYPLEKTLEGEVRQRQVGGGAKGVLPEMEEELLFIVVYQKTHPLQTMQGLHFGLSQPQANYWIHHLLPVLQHALADLGLAPEREASRVAESPLALEGMSELAIDGSERRRQRPQDAIAQKGHYSGKKRKRIPTKTSWWSLGAPVRWSIWGRPWLAKPMTRKRLMRRASPIPSTLPWTRTPVFRAMSLKVF